MRLIDADALQKHKQLEAFGNGQYEDVEIVYGNDIDNAPTIEAEPVKHGRWIGIGRTSVTCSECGEWTEVAGNYCPNCGAKMEGGEDGK